MSLAPTKTDDDFFESTACAKAPGKMGCTDPLLGSAFNDEFLSNKQSTIPLEDDNPGEIGEAGDLTNGSKIKKRDDNLPLEMEQYVSDNKMGLDDKKQMKKGKPLTHLSPISPMIPAVLREKRLKKSHDVAAVTEPSKIFDQQADVTDIRGKKQMNWHQKTEKGKLVTSPIESFVKMTADPREKILKKSHDEAVVTEPLKLLDLQADVTDIHGKKSMNRHQKTEKGKFVTSPIENEGGMPAYQGKKNPSKPSVTLQRTETSDVQVNRIDQWGKDQKDHQKGKKGKMDTSCITNRDSMPIDHGKIGAPQACAETISMRASSKPEFQVSNQKDINQSTNFQDRKAVKRRHSVDPPDPGVPCIKKMKHSWQAINLLKRKYEGQQDGPMVKKRVMDFVELFEALSIWQ